MGCWMESLAGGLTFKCFLVFKMYLEKMGNKDGKEFFVKQSLIKKRYFFRLGVVFIYWKLKCILNLFSQLPSSLTEGKMFLQA